MTFPDDTATTLPSDSEAHPAGDYPTHTADGKQVVGYDNGTSRPSSAPIDADTPVAPSAPAGAQDLAHLDGAVTRPVLVMPDGMRFETAAALSTIGELRMRQDEQWGGPDHDDQHDGLAWINFIDDHLQRAADKGPSDIEGMIDKLTDVAALAAAAMESLQRRLDGRRRTVTAIDPSVTLAGGEPPYQAEA